jgi:hypothetical protein
LDPVFLRSAERWQGLAAEGKEFEDDRPFLLVYCTSHKAPLPRLVKHVKKTTGLPVVTLSLTALDLIPQSDTTIYDAGPLQFLSLLSRATCVLTNSFHATAFSIIFRRPFWTVRHRATNARMADLLGRIGLQERQVLETSEMPDAPLDIDYSGVQAGLSREIAVSVEFLRRSLGADL